MLSRTVHPNILNHSLWWGSCSLCFCRVNSGSSMAEELVRGTRRTLPSADCCKLYSYGEYWFPSGSRRCCRMTHSSVVTPLLFFTSEYIQVRALLPLKGFYAMFQIMSLKSAASSSMQSELLLHAAQGLLTVADKSEFINQKMGGRGGDKIK